MTSIALPIWPPASDTAFFASAKAVFNEFRGYGLPIPGSFGMVVNFEFESAFEIGAKGDYVNGVPTAFAMGQWHEPRISQIKTAIGIDVTTFASAISGKPTEMEIMVAIGDQCAAAWYELTSNPAFGLAELRAATTASEGGMAGCKYFERAGESDAMQRRGLGGERWAVYAAENGWV
jgi:hypothetical protein